jgi:hypothetical protein
VARPAKTKRIVTHPAKLTAGDGQWLSKPPSKQDRPLYDPFNDLLHTKNKKSFNKYRRWQPQRERHDVAAQRGFQPGTGPLPQFRII